MGNKTCDLMKSGKTVLFAFEEAIGIASLVHCWRASARGTAPLPFLRNQWIKKSWGSITDFSLFLSVL